MFPPELLLLMGINVFVALSLLASIFDGQFPTVVPFSFQIAALAGFGQIWVNYAFLFFFVEVRFWGSMLYLCVALIAVIAVNVYIAINKRLLNGAMVYLGALTVPVTFLSYFLVSSYVNGVTLSLPWFPIVPVESIYMVLALCAAILGFSIIVSAKPGMVGKIFRIGQKQGNSPKTVNPALRPEDDPKKKEERR